MGIYTVVTAIVIPTVIILGFNMSIFIYTRNSVRRVENHDINAGISQQQQFRINRRDISLIKQMIFIFTVFIIGWCPAFVINTITATSRVDDRIQMVCIYLSEICLICLMINLFVFNHDI